MRVYALVGPSGTGKSYKALEVAYANNIDYIIDDGILVHKNKIIAGKSAKRSNSIIEAVKIAIFHNEDHRSKVMNKIVESKIENLLIIGTSIKMIKQIKNALELPDLYKTIFINEISTQEEIDTALNSRKGGNHIIPVPVIQIKQITRGLKINPLKRIRKKNTSQNRILEKTIIRPSFSSRGNVYISKDIIEQIVEYELKKNSTVSKVNNIDIVDLNDEININININIQNTELIKECSRIQFQIKGAIEKITLINIVEINVYINKLKILRNVIVKK